MTTVDPRRVVIGHALTCSIDFVVIGCTSAVTHSLETNSSRSLRVSDYVNLYMYIKIDVNVYECACELECGQKVPLKQKQRVKPPWST